MADEKLTDQDPYAGTLALTDLIHVVDVSDTTQDPAGSSYALELGDLANFINSFSLNIYNSDGTLTANRLLTGGGLELNFEDVQASITGSGNTSGTYALEIFNSDNLPISQFRDDLKAFFNGATFDATVSIKGKDGDYAFNVSALNGIDMTANALIVRKEGYVGINCDPTKRFEVNEDSSLMAFFRGSNGGGRGIVISNSNTAGRTSYSFAQDTVGSSTPYTIERYGSTHPSFANKVEFINAVSGTTGFLTGGTEKITLHSSGYNGFNKINPSCLFDMKGISDSVSNPIFRVSDNADERIFEVINNTRLTRMRGATDQTAVDIFCQGVTPNTVVDFLTFTEAANFLWGGISVAYLDPTTPDEGYQMIFKVNETTTGTPTERMRLNQHGLGLGAAEFGTGGSHILAIGNGTEPTVLANGIEIYSVDSDDNTATLGLFLEQAVEAIGTFTPSHKIKVKINGALYHIQLDAV